MTQEEKKHLDYRIEDEGLEYTFIYSSEFIWITDKEFHVKREEFIKAYKDFKKWLNDNGIMTD